MKVIQASAPGRCGIIGNPSDIYGGTVVSCSIPARARCRLTIGQSGAEPADPTLWRAALARFPLTCAEVEWTTDIPRSNGLSGSTALLAATLACVTMARGCPPDIGSVEGRSAFAELVRDVERFEAGIMCGYQDAYMVVHGGLQRMDFAGKHPVDPGPTAQLSSLGADLPFLLITTGVERLSGSVHGPMSDRWVSGDSEVIEKMLRVADLGRQGAEALTGSDWTRLAGLMDENQEITASLGGSGEDIDRLIKEAKACGALSAKLAGAGLGGTVIALTLEPETLQSRLSERGYSRFMRPLAGPGLRFEGGL